MFREMRRFKQQIPNEECIEILKNEPRGVLSVLGDNGYPYGVPMDHWYSEIDGKLYFHCAKDGHKLDAISKCDKVSYCVMDKGYQKEGEWALNIRCVILRGHIRRVDDEKLAIRIGTAITRKFTDDEEYLQHELEHALPRAQCLEFIPVHMSGKLVKEA